MTYSMTDSDVKVAASRVAADVSRAVGDAGEKAGEAVASVRHAAAENFDKVEFCYSAQSSCRCQHCRRHRVPVGGPRAPLKRFMIHTKWGRHDQRSLSLCSKPGNEWSS